MTDLNHQASFSRQVSQLVETLPGAVAIFDRTMCYVAHNEGWVKSHNLKDAIPLIGRNHYDIYPNIPARWREAHQLALKDGKSSRAEHDSYLDPAGKLYHIKWNVSPLRSEEGDIIGLVMVTRLINKEIEALERERFDRQRLQYALEGAQDGMWDWNTVTSDVFYSRRWVEMLGYQYEELEQSFGTFHSLLHPDDVAQAEEDVAACVGGRSATLRMQFRMRHKDGSYRWILSRGRVVDWNPEGHPRRLVGIHTDITATKELEVQLMAASEAANQSSQAKSEFLANMSHEVRTPLNGILGMAGLLSRTELDKEQKEFTNKILASGRALLDIVNDILDISRLEAGRVELEAETFNLAEVVESVSSLLGAIASEKGLKLRANHLEFSNIWLMGDAGRVRQIFFNLVGNAIKFTDEGSVNIIVSAEAEGETMRLNCQVVDTGVGIEEEDQKRLFDRFSQVDGTYTRKHQGTGLGLAISKQLVELMDGTITIESKPGAGSCFKFSLYLKPGQPREIEARKTEFVHHSPVGPLHILVAEDNPVNQLLVQKLLEAEGHTVDIVSNGEEAVHAVCEIRYDLLLMDVQMPVMDGCEAARRIRAFKGPASSLPIIAFTANAMQGQREEYLAAGMDDYVSKPVEPARLFSAIHRTFKKYEQDRLSVSAYRRSSQSVEPVQEAVKVRATSPTGKLACAVEEGTLGKVKKTSGTCHPSKKQMGSDRAASKAASEAASEAALDALLKDL